MHYKLVSLIFKEPIKFPVHFVKHEIFIHRHEPAREEGQDIYRSCCAPPAAKETEVQNRPLRPARRRDFGLGSNYHFNTIEVLDLWETGEGNQDV